MPYERFVMLLKSRSRRHHPHMHYSYTRGRHKKHAIPSRSTQKCFTLTLGVNTKKYPIGYTPNKCYNFLLLSLKSFVVEKRHVAMQKLFMKKGEKNKSIRKNG
jgi:hypothetical protein